MKVLVLTCSHFKFLCSKILNRPKLATAGLLDAPVDTEKQKNKESQVLDKPASQESDLKSLVCLSALKTLSVRNWNSIGGCWASCLLQMFGLFTDVLSGQTYISLGFQHAGALVFEVEKIEEELWAVCSSAPSMLHARARVKLLHIFEIGSELDQFEGIPYKPCALAVVLLWVFN